MVIFKAAVVVCSDKCAKGVRVDTSGEYIKEFLIAKKFDVIEKVIITDDIDTIKNKLLYYTDEMKIDLIITTGGTGFSPRDNTPEATKEIIKREIPGIGEMLRAESYKVTPRAYLSRGISGIRDRTLIINLPGSLKAVKENLSFLDDVLGHGLKILKLVDTDCGI